MVGFAATSPETGTRRIAACLEQAGVPGEPGDLDWMARRLERFVRRLEPGRERVEAEGIVLTGFLRSLGLEPADCVLLRGRAFPDPLLEAVPELLKTGCTALTWQLLRFGILRYAGAGAGVSARWRVDAGRVAPLLEAWHEMGEDLVFRQVARGMKPLLEDVFRVEILVAGVDPGRGREWARELKTRLRRDLSDDRVVVRVLPRIVTA